MELTGLLPVLRRWLVVVLIATGMATLVGWALASTADETYEAEALLLVGPLNTDNDTMRASSTLSQTYAELATSDAVLDDVETTTGVPRTELNDGVRATANGTTRLLTIRAAAGEADTAAAVANAVATGLVDLGAQDALRPEGQLRIIEPAAPPGSPISPTDLVVPLAALAGLLGSATLVLIFEFAGDMAETAEKVGEASGAATLSVRRKRRWWPGGNRRADPMKVVATQVELAAPDVRSVLITGASELDGTDALGRDLARLWAERREQVVVLDSTGERITIWGLPPSDDAPWSESLTEAGARDLIDQMAPDGHMVVVLAPSAITSTATLVWARVADATLLGVRRFQARRAQVRDAADNLRSAGAEVTFAVLHDGGKSGAGTPPDADVGRAEARGAPVEAEAVEPAAPRQNGSRRPVAAAAAGKGSRR